MDKNTANEDLLELIEIQGDILALRRLASLFDIETCALISTYAEKFERLARLMDGVI